MPTACRCSSPRIQPATPRARSWPPRAPPVARRCLAASLPASGNRRSAGHFDRPAVAAHGAVRRPVAGYCHAGACRCGHAAAVHDLFAVSVGMGKTAAATAATSTVRRRERAVWQMGRTLDEGCAEARMLGAELTSLFRTGLRDYRSAQAKRRGCGLRSRHARRSAGAGYTAGATARRLARTRAPCCRT